MVKNSKSTALKYIAQGIQDEKTKCASDPIYFISKYIRVVHPVRGLVPFDLFKFQQRIVKEFFKNRFNIIKKFRQAGITTICCAYALWYTLFQDEKSVLVVSIGDRESTFFLERVWRMYEELPTFLKIPTRERNKHVLKFENNSKVKSVPSSDSAGRGESISLLIIDEAAFIDNMEVFWAAIFPTISTGGEAIALSTVNGMANWYYQFYNDAVTGNNTFNVIDIFWQEHPDYTQEWSISTRKNIGERRWRQEFECEFLGTGDTFINFELLQALTDNIDDDFETKYNNRMYIWKYPEPLKEYIIAVDAGHGVGRDFSSFHIIDLATGEQVAEFYSNTVDLKEFANIIAYEGEYYNTAYCVVERNNLGIELIRKLFDELEYENIMNDPEPNKNHMGVQIGGFAKREAILTAMDTLLRENKIRIRSKRTVREFQTFIITENGRFEAEDGFHDDLVMSLGIACYCFKDILGSTPLEQELGLSAEDRSMQIDAIFVSNRQTEEVDNVRWLYDN